ncbi:hypothetical protein ACQ2H7_000989 [Candidozyma auris]
MNTPPTPIHPAPDQEVADLPQTKLDGDNLDLNPTLEDDLDDDDVSMQSTRPTEGIGDDKDNVKVEITSWTMPFEDAYEAELLNLQQQKHPEVSIGQQSKLISYLDNEFLKVQRKFVKNQAESRHEYSLHSLLEDLSQILDVLWVSISPEHELFGQEEYFIKVLGDLEDWVDWYDLSEYDCLDRKTEIFLFGLFTFFQKVDVRISLLVDGIEKKGDLRSKFDRTQLLGDALIKLMWPFGSSKPEKDVTSELPEELKDFYKEVTPTKQRVTQDSKDERVAKILNRQQAHYTHELDQFKRDYSAQKASAINCAELQAAVLKCYEGWSFFGADNCSAEIKRASKCNELQERAFQKLRYNDCYSQRQCSAIRYLVDQLFIKNFGQLGENVNDESQVNFEKDLDNAFEKVWK